MLRLFVLCMMIIIAAVSAQAQPAAVKWSTLGVVADGKSDNAQALNALPANASIIGDCPAGQPIRNRSCYHQIDPRLTGSQVMAIPRIRMQVLIKPANRSMG